MALIHFIIIYNNDPNLANKLTRNFRQSNHHIYLGTAKLSQSQPFTEDR